MGTGENLFVVIQILSHGDEMVLQQWIGSGDKQKGVNNQYVLGCPKDITPRKTIVSTRTAIEHKNIQYLM